MTLFCGSMLGSAQAVHYSYDAAGNRVRREIVINQQNAPQHNSRSTFYTDNLADDYRVKLHTSSSSSVIRVEVVSQGECQYGTVTVFNLSGMKVNKVNIEDGSACVDISDSPNGVYIIHIDINGKTTDWKIIKQ